MTPRCWKFSLNVERYVFVDLSSLRLPPGGLHFIACLADLVVCRRRTWPAKRRRRVVTKSRRGFWLTRCRTSSFVIWSRQVIPRVRRKHLCWKLSSLHANFSVFFHVSLPVNRRWHDDRCIQQELACKRNVACFPNPLQMLEECCCFFETCVAIYFCISIFWQIAT